MHTSLLSMRSTVTKTNVASKIKPKFFTNFETYQVQPSIVDFPSYESSQNNTKNNQQKKKWYQRKAFKYPARFVMASPFLCYLMDKYEYQSMLNESEDIAEIDHELYEVMLQIKKDLEVTHEINFRIGHNLPEHVSAQFIKGNKLRDNFLPEIPSTILLTPKYKSLSKSYIIHTIAHELEHARQAFEYPESYNIYTDPMALNENVQAKKREMGADAGSSDYQYCYPCLESVALQKNFIEYEPQDTQYGYFTTKLGYFSPQDYDLWIQRAKEDCALCPAHKAGTADNPNTPLKDFLPQNS